GWRCCRPTCRGVTRWLPGTPTRPRPPSSPSAAAGARPQGEMATRARPQGAGGKVSVRWRMNEHHDLVPSLASHLALRGEITPVGWLLPADLSAEEWKQGGEALVKLEQSRQWFIGDWWNAGQHYGERQAACEEIGIEYGTAANAGQVSQNFENFSRRREKLT